MAKVKDGTKTFIFSIDSDLYDEFNRYFGDYGMRSAILRRCIRLAIAVAKGQISGEKMVAEVVNTATKEVSKVVLGLDPEWEG